MSYKSLMRFLVFLILILTLYILGPRMVAAAWHLKYGDQMHQLGATIRVPDRWFALRQENGPAMFTVKPSWSFKIFDFDSITFAPLPPVEGLDAKEQYEHWETGASNRDFVQVHRVQKVRTFQAGGRRVSCYERTNPIPETSFSASCMVEGRMIVSFYGKENSSNEFYKILTSMTF